MIYNNQGVKIESNYNVGQQQDNYTSNYNRLGRNYNSGYSHYQDSSKRDYNKDQLKWQRKNNKWIQIINNVNVYNIK